MRMKLIVSLLALCLSLSVVSVQAQNNVFGNMEDIDVIMTGNITETITCDIIGNAVIVEEMEFTDNMSNVTGSANAAESTTLDVTGKIILIKDFGNMTERAVMVGRADDISGNVVIFGEKENMTEGMDSTAGNMTNVTEDMTVITTGNMTGSIIFNAAEGMDNATGMNNMTEGMDNITVLMTGNMTGTVTGDMTRRMIVIKNVGEVSEIAEALSNLAGMNESTDDMTGPTTCNLTGKMVVIRNMDNATMDSENIDNLVTMDGNAAILHSMDDTTGMNQNMNSATGKVVMITKLDDVIGITTNTITCNTTQSMVMIRTMGDVTGDMTGNETGDQTGDMTGNVTGETTEVSINNFAFDPESVTISTGDTVRWTNMDSEEHTATGSTFDSGTLEEGDSYEFTFTEPGTFEYSCSIHPEMEGTVTVTEDMTGDTTDDTVDEDEDTTSDEDEGM